MNSSRQKRTTLALNPHAATFQLRSYPHVTSNSRFKYLPEFSPRNVVDGNAAAGEEPPQVPYWRPNRRTDLWLKIEFGRMVETGRVVLYLRTMPDQEKTWWGQRVGDPREQGVGNPQ